MAKNLGGRPRVYKTPGDLKKKIDAYFAGGYRMMTRYTTDGEPYKVPDITISDLVLYLGFADRHSFYAHEQIPRFSHVIKNARSRIEREYESLLKMGNCTGAIFALKNFGWSDRTDLTVTETKRLVIERYSETENEVKKVSGPVRLQPKEIPRAVELVGDRKNVVAHLAGNVIQRADS